MESHHTFQEYHGLIIFTFCMHEVNIIMNQNIFWNGQAYLLCHVKCQVNLLK
jgi:hypothetical protein